MVRAATNCGEAGVNKALENFKLAKLRQGLDEARAAAVVAAEDPPAGTPAGEDTAAGRPAGAPGEDDD
jgi:hypothetical protein